MRQKDIITLILALSIAFLSALVSKSLFEKNAAGVKKTPVEVPQVSHEIMTEVLVANQNINIGEPIKSHMMMWQKWPKEAVLGTYLVRNNDTEDQYQKLLNGLSKRQISRGEPITADDVIKTGDRSFLAAIVKPGMRAVSLPLGSSAAGSSLLSPGDRVDVISANIFSPTGVHASNFSGTTLVENAKVLAVDRHLGVEHKMPSDSKGVQLTTEEGAKFITIEVTPEEAEILSMATKLGELTFSLRGMETVTQKNKGETIQKLKKRLQEQLGEKNQGVGTLSPTMSTKFQTVIRRGTELSSLNFIKDIKEGKESWNLVLDNKGAGGISASLPSLGGGVGPLLGNPSQKGGMKKGSKKEDSEEETEGGMSFGVDPQKNTAQVQALIQKMKNQSSGKQEETDEV